MRDRQGRIARLRRFPPAAAPHAAERRAGFRRRGGRKSRPRASLATSVSPCSARRSSRRRPSNSPQSISIRRGSAAGARPQQPRRFRGSAAAAISKPTSRGIAAAAPCAAMSRARPRESGMSARPCSRRAAFQSVGRVAQQRERRHGVISEAAASRIRSEAWPRGGDVMLRGDLRQGCGAEARALCRIVEQRRRLRRANAAASPGGVSRPVRPSATISATPPLSPATTGRPAACASSNAMP